MESRLRDAVARIDIVQDAKAGSRGTGFLVAPDLVLTAFHVIADRSASGVALHGRIALTFPTHSTEATVIEGLADPRADWILLRCATAPPGVGPIPLTDRVSDEEPWETFGFPDANPRDGMVFTGHITHATGTFDAVPVYQVFSREAAAGTGAPVKGLSGGPVVVDGAVVGLLRSSLMRDGQNVAGTLYACPIDLILERCGNLLPSPDTVRGLPGFARRPLPATPFRFLERFTSADAEIFFGRNREIRQLYDQVTSPDGARVVLLYGQSGAGKSSFLDAGLLPRLETTHTTAYLRRDRAKGVLATLVEGISTLPTVVAGAAPLSSLTATEALRLTWLAAETATGRPLVVVLDQVEEVFTMPANDSNELSALMEGLMQLFQDVPTPRGRLILGFRKEWLAELQEVFNQGQLDYSKTFLGALNRDAIIEIVTGFQRSNRLTNRYGLEIEQQLAEAIARDLTSDRESPVAPMLQVLLSRLWRVETDRNQNALRFTLALYEQLRDEGFRLTDFLDQQLAALGRAAATAGGSVTDVVERLRDQGFRLTNFLDQQLAALGRAAATAGGSVSDVVESGLALDVLRFHTSEFGTAWNRSADELAEEYRHRRDIAWLMGELKGLYLLSEPGGQSQQAKDATRLAHDTLAAAVRARFDESDRPGQRARRILENRAREWTDAREGTPLDARDLVLVEQGLAGMRALREDEGRLLRVSRIVREQNERASGRRGTIAWASHLSSIVPFTIWSMIKSPGTTVKAYLDGKRERYQGPITYFWIGYMFFFVFATYVAEPNGLMPVASSTRPMLTGLPRIGDVWAFFMMVGMSLIAYICGTRGTLTLIETILAFLYMYGTLFFASPFLILAEAPFRAALLSIPPMYRNLVADVPPVVLLIYLGYNAAKTMQIPMSRVALTVAVGITYYFLTAFAFTSSFI